MSEDNRLKKTTRRAFGKKRRRPWNARRNSARHVPKSPLAGLNTEPHPSTSSVDASSGSIERIILTELPVDASNTEPQPTTSSVYASSTHAVSAGVESIRRSSVGCSSAKTQLGASSVDTSSAHVSSAVMERVDTIFLSAEENSQRTTSAANVKKLLASKSATKRKFELLAVDMEQENPCDSGTEFLIVDLSVFNHFLGMMTCPDCGDKAATVSKDPRKEYGLCVKLVMTCSTCGMREERFSSPRVTGDALITPFEVNVCAMKAIQGIGKGATALTDFFCNNEHFKPWHASQDLSGSYGHDGASMQ